MLFYHTETFSERLISILRLPVAGLLAMVVTIFLFYLMQFLIASGEKAITGQNLGNIVEFTRIKQEQIVETKKRRPEPPPLPDEPPKVATPRVQANTNTEGWSNVFKPLNTAVQVNSSLNFRSDGEYLPILKVQPVYPTKALERGLVGWVVVEFTVDEVGKVINPIVIDHCVEVQRIASTELCYDRPGRIFDKPALAAASRFKYKPKVIDGQAIATAGVRNMITFLLED
jgi:periplasmic protein TonB